MSQARAPGHGETDTPAWAVELLRDARVARLATADGAGRPLVIPICYAFDGERVYSVVDAKPKRTRALRRLRNIAENPHVSLVVDLWDEDWTRLAWVIVEGRADVVPDGADHTRAIELLLAKYPQYRSMDLARTAGPVIRVTPVRLLAWRSA